MKIKRRKNKKGKRKMMSEQTNGTRYNQEIS